MNVDVPCTRRSRLAILHPPLLAVVLLLAVPTAAAPQAISGFVGRAWSGYERMPSPLVGGAELRSFQVAGFSLRFGLRRGWDHVTRTGTTCEGGWPSYGSCVDEPIRTSITMTTKWLGLGYRYLRDANFVDLEVRRTEQTLDGRVRGLDTGRSVPDLIPTGPYRRWGVDISVGRLILGSKNLAWKVGYSFDPTSFRACGTDVGTPFCGTSSAVQALSVGLEFGVW